MTKKINILLATEAFYPDGWGGAHTYVYNLAKYMQRLNDFAPVVLTIKTQNSADSQIMEGFRVYRYNSALKGRFVVFMRPLLSFINSYRYHQVPRVVSPGNAS